MTKISVHPVNGDFLFAQYEDLHGTNDWTHCNAPDQTILLKYQVATTSAIL